MPEEALLENPIAVIGDEDLVLGLKVLGFKIYPVCGPQDYNTVFAKLLNDKVAICLMEDKVYQVLTDKINSSGGQNLPIIIPFSKSGKTELLETILKNVRLRAQGAA
ncbi:MAG: V-type ATP synthase subunit F [Candidatus Omnitrophica bacterium]|nr:V-type ATP synthase subunit F [Candidatus Omnitrophota bacterium]